MTTADILSTYNDSITKYAGQYGIDANEIAAVIQTESSGNPNAYLAEPKLNDASYGLMQLLGTTAQALGYQGDVNGLYDPDTNISLGTKLLAQLHAKYGDNAAAVYSAYNSGSGTAYQTNSQVASNVQRFLDNLASVASQTVSEAGQVISDNPEASGSLAVIVIAVLVFFFMRRR